MYPGLRSLIEHGQFQQCVLNPNAVPAYFNEFVENGLANYTPQLSSIDVSGIPQLPELSEVEEGRIIGLLWDQYLDPTVEIVQVPHDSSIDDLLTEPLISTPIDPKKIVAV